MFCTNIKFWLDLRLIRCSQKHFAWISFLQILGRNKVQSKFDWSTKIFLAFLAPSNFFKSINPFKSYAVYLVYFIPIFADLKVKKPQCDKNMYASVTFERVDRFWKFECLYRCQWGEKMFFSAVKFWLDLTLFRYSQKHKNRQILKNRQIFRNDKF